MEQTETFDLAVNERETTAVFPTDVPRWSSGQANSETVYDASDGHGHCRWCGGETSAHYPKNGRALTYRCCSLFCQIFYAVGLGLFELPLKTSGAINIAECRRQLGALDDVTIRGNLLPEWREKSGSVGSMRLCLYSGNGKHTLPHDARANQVYCGAACRTAAFRSVRK